MKKICLVLGIFLLLCSTAHAYNGTPMLFQHLGWNYEKEGESLHGFIPSLEEVTRRPWKLGRWTGIFRFSDGKSSTIPNYDVFNIKKKMEDDNFDKENGFGLVYKSKSALGELFDKVYSSYKGQKTTKQWNHFRDTFINSADDPDFKEGHEYFYELKRESFLRTAGIAQRFGAKFTRTEKVSEEDRRAHYTVSDWPELSVKNVGSKVKINYAASGYTHREVRVVAVPKGKWLGGYEHKITTITTDIEGTYKPVQPIEVEMKDITKGLGLKETDKVDFILDDGYGRTAIVSSPATAKTVGNVDFVPTKLNLMDNGQLWMTFRFDGKEPVSKQSIVNPDGMPMLAKVHISGAVTQDFSLPLLYRTLPSTLQPKQTYRFMLGKIDIGKKVGKYTITCKGIVNNPNHPKRALETPDIAYENNEIQKQWTREVKAPATDLVAVSIQANPSSIKVMQKTTVTAQVKNIGATAQSNVDIEFFANGTKIHSVKKDLPANRTVAIGGFPYQPTQVGVSTLSVHVDPHKQKEDKNRSNNVATTGCTVTNQTNREGHGRGIVGGCNQPQKTANWTVAYSLITGYPERKYSWTDSNGYAHYADDTYTDYNDPIWENRNVTYQESLKIDTSLNTKQGIKTDLEHPKDSDRESRGSWEIRGYAKKNGLNPNHITRAGYGVELKVTTTYHSDWETKVPHGFEHTAKPLGTKYKGTPDKVYATIYTKKGNRVKTIPLDKTSDNGQQATFEFPIKEYEDKVVGKTFKYRKFFTNPKWPDGEYRIRIETDGVGATGIKQCQDVKYTIYGSMFDDIQNLRVFSKE